MNGKEIKELMAKVHAAEDKAHELLELAANSGDNKTAFFYYAIESILDALRIILGNELLRLKGDKSELEGNTRRASR